MAKFRTKMNAHNRVTIPVEIRRSLGLRPGTIVEWYKAGDAFELRRRRRPAPSRTSARDRRTKQP